MGEPRKEDDQATHIVLFLGPGGVGKTTMSAAYGIAAAQQGERVAVLTIDPARRLANALGLPSEALSHDVTEVEGKWPGQLSATMLDPAAMFAQVIGDQATSAEHRDRILGNRIFQNLSSSLSGTNEYMACERLYELSASGHYDRVIVDTPPAKHAFDFLDSPQRLTRFLDHDLYKTIFSPKPGILKTLNIAAQRLLKILGGAVGSDLVDDVVDFFADFEGLDAGFSQRAHSIDKLLASKSASYVLVTSPKSEPLRECRWITHNLAQRDRTFRAIVANRTSPIVLNEDADRWAKKPVGALPENFAEMHQLAIAENTALKELGGSASNRVDAVPTTKPSPVDFVGIPEQPEPVHDMEALSALAKRLSDYPALW